MADRDDSEDYEFYLRQLDKKFKRDEYLEKIAALKREYRDEEYTGLLSQIVTLHTLGGTLRWNYFHLKLHKAVRWVLTDLPEVFSQADIEQEIGKRDPLREINKTSLRVILARLVRQDILEVFQRGTSKRPTLYRISMSALRTRYGLWGQGKAAERERKEKQDGIEAQ